MSEGPISLARRVVGNLMETWVSAGRGGAPTMLLGDWLRRKGVTVNSNTLDFFQRPL